MGNAQYSSSGLSNKQGLRYGTSLAGSKKKFYLCGKKQKSL